MRIPFRTLLYAALFALGGFIQPLGQPALLNPTGSPGPGQGTNLETRF
jgi:hypothetical protein